MDAPTLALTHSPFVPLAIGFCGLGTGYFVSGGQALFGFPKAAPDVDRTTAMWGFWMPGFLQFLTGIDPIVGLTWFDVFFRAGDVPAGDEQQVGDRGRGVGALAVLGDPHRPGHAHPLGIGDVARDGFERFDRHAADAILAAYDLLQALHDRGILGSVEPKWFKGVVSVKTPTLPVLHHGRERCRTGFPLSESRPHATRRERKSSCRPNTSTTESF
jgi:hypothetical protein